MTTNLPSSLLPFAFFFILIVFLSPPFPTALNGLGSASTTAITYGVGAVCGIVAGESTQRIQCYQNGQTLQVLPNVSFQAISGGRSFFCGLRSGGFTLLCWDTTYSNNSTLLPKRLYYSPTVQLTDLSVGDSQVCAREVDSGTVRCWRGRDRNGNQFSSPKEYLRFRGVTSGSGFSCGILRQNYSVRCWGQSGSTGDEIQRQFRNLSMSSLVAGESHVCGLTINGALACKGNNSSGQLNVPLGSSFSSPEFSGLALGANFTCAIRSRNGLVVCWGQITNMIQNVSFESIVAGLDYVCGLTTGNLSVNCWGPGWSSTNNLVLPLGMVIPGPCVEDSCSSCSTYPNSQILCHGSGSICYSCQTQIPLAVPIPVTPPASPSPSSSEPDSPIPSSKYSNRTELLAFLIVGSVGAFVGLCSILYCLWVLTRRLLNPKVDNSVQPSPTEPNEDDVFPTVSTTDTTVRSFSSKRQSSRTIRNSHRRSGSSSKLVDKAESFTFSELSAATDNFSAHNKIGAGSFSVVYRGKLHDGREVAIKRGETSAKKKKFQEIEIAFDSELALLSRLHHKHLVSLMGFCDENEERLLVYEYMPNGSLHDHLHSTHNTEKASSAINSWRMRIKIALDAARGVEYLHNYAVPSIIHRDIKSSNILLDSNWKAKVSDFGLSLMGDESEQEVMISTKAVGTVGYIDPEYYVMSVLTTKSDVYGLGVVMLELLTGKKAVFREGEGDPVGVVEYAGRRIAGGELWKVLDYRVGEAEVNENEGVEIMAYTAMQCVSLEGKGRPSASEVVGNLERALAFVEGSPATGSFSAPPFSSSAPFD